jgi:phage tail-like protein
MSFNRFDGAVGMYWKFKVDGLNLGSFTTCEGLGMEVLVEQREEGGNNFFVHQLPGRLRFPNIKFGRPINKDSEKVAQWFMDIARGGVKPMNGQIVALTPEGQVVAQWGLIGVIPVRWTGPGFSSDSVKAATETVEIAHHGFLDPAKSELKANGATAGGTGRR